MTHGGRVQLPAEVEETVRREGEAAYPEECCGALLGRGGGSAEVVVVRAEPVRNTKEQERERRYLIDPLAVVRIEEQADAAGLQLVGFYHSHPDVPAIPSQFDRDYAWPWYTYLIVSVRQGQARELRAWSLAEDRSAFGERAVVEASPLSEGAGPGA